jgi:hypothetical protein
LAELPTFTGVRVNDSGSLVGSQIVFKHTETGLDSNDNPLPYTPTSATVSIVAPSGILTPAVIILPGTLNEVQLLQTIVDEAPAGEYTVNWTMNVAGQIVNRRETYFVGFTDIQDQTRALLQVDNTVVTNYDVDLMAAQVIRSITGPGMYQNVLPIYNNLPIGDQSCFDRAVALLCAAGIRPWMPVQAPIGDIVAIQSGQDRFQYSTPTNGMNKRSIEDRWEDQAFEQLVATSVIGDVLRDLQDSTRIFSVNGYRRDQIKPMEVGVFGQVYANPGFLRWTGLYDYGRDAFWSWGK